MVCCIQVLFTKFIETRRERIGFINALDGDRVLTNELAAAQAKPKRKKPSCKTCKKPFGECPGGTKKKCVHAPTSNRVVLAQHPQQPPQHLQQQLPRFMLPPLTLHDPINNPFLYPFTQGSTYGHNRSAAFVNVRRWNDYETCNNEMHSKYGYRAVSWDQSFEVDLRDLYIARDSQPGMELTQTWIDKLTFAKRQFSN